MPSAPTTADAIILGYNLEELTPVENGIRIDKWYDGAFPFGIENARIFVEFECALGLADAVDYPWNTPYPDPRYKGCVVRRIMHEDQAATTRVTFIYESESFLIEIGPGQTIVELETSLRQIPLEQHPRFSTLSTDDFLNIDTAINILKSNDYEIRTPTTDDPFQITPNTGPAISLSGADDPTNPIGTARELFLQKLKGVEVVDVNAGVLTVTTGYADNSWAGLEGDNDKLQYPGYGVTGTALNWKRCDMRVQHRGSVTQVSQRWEYNPFQWDPRYYPRL